MQKYLPKFRIFFRGALVVAFITLAVYGGMVSYYYLFPEKERPPIVIPLEEMSLSFGTKGSVATSSQNAEDMMGNLPQLAGQNQDSSSQSVSDEQLVDEFLSLLRVQNKPGSSQQGAKAGNLQEGKIQFSGDLKGLDFSKQGLKDALPKGMAGTIKGMASQKRKSEQISEESMATEVKEADIDPQTKKAIEDYITASSKIEFPDKPIMTYRAIMGLKEEGKEGKLTELISKYEGGYQELKSLNPPEKIKGFHKNSLEAMERLIATLKAFKSNPVEDVVGSQETKELQVLTQATIMQLEEIIKKYNLDLPPEVLTGNP